MLTAAPAFRAASAQASPMPELPLHDDHDGRPVQFPLAHNR